MRISSTMEGPAHFLSPTFRLSLEKNSQNLVQLMIQSFVFWILHFAIELLLLNSDAGLRPRILEILPLLDHLFVKLALESCGRVLDQRIS
jgi:hypothetical protein